MVSMILYDFTISPACRAVKMTAQYFDIELELKNVDLYKLENMNEEFLEVSKKGNVLAVRVSEPELDTVF